MKSVRRILLTGSINSGKDAVFSELTGSSGYYKYICEKEPEYGEYYYKFNDYELISLPEISSLSGNTEYEKTARLFIESLEYDCLVCVLDAVNLEENLSLVLHISEITDKIVVLLTGCDEAKNRNIIIDSKKLSEMLGIPVAEATAKSGKGINELLEAVHLVVTGAVLPLPEKIIYVSPIEQALRALEFADIRRYDAIKMLEQGSEPDGLKQKNAYIKACNILERFNLNGSNFSENLALSAYRKSHFIVNSAVQIIPSETDSRESALNRVIVLRALMTIFMLVLLGIILYITAAGKTAFEDYKILISGEASLNSFNFIISSLVI